MSGTFDVTWLDATGECLATSEYKAPSLSAACHIVASVLDTYPWGEPRANGGIRRAAHPSGFTIAVRQERAS